MKKNDAESGEAAVCPRCCGGAEIGPAGDRDRSETVDAPVGVARTCQTASGCGMYCPGAFLTFSGRFLPPRKLQRVCVKVPNEVLFILYQAFVINRSASWPLSCTLGGKSAAGVFRRGEEVL